MLSSAQEKILRALFKVLIRVSRALLKSGLGYKEFSEIAKAAFVETATADYGIRGRPTNISRVAVMTGLTRKEVRRIREKTSTDEVYSNQKRISPYSVLLRWYSDPKYQDSSGQPLELPFEHGDITFTTLVRDSGGDIPPGAMRTELVRMGVVTLNSDDRLSPTSRFYSPSDLDDRLALSLEASVSRLLDTIIHNTSEECNEDRRIERTIYTRCISSSDLNRVADLLQERLKDFGWSIDEFITGYEAEYFRSNAEPSESGIGIGIYYFED